MSEPLYHQTAQGRRGIPAWWFGAPVVAFAYSFLAPRFIPDIVAMPEEFPRGVAVAMRWFVGLIGGVALLSAWQLVKWARSRQRA